MWKEQGKKKTNGIWIRRWEVTKRTRRMNAKLVRMRIREGERGRGRILVKKMRNCGGEDDSMMIAR
jgi:hypothetical protein